jgi:predicted PurR-regulated permease PerM
MRSWGNNDSAIERWRKLGVVVWTVLGLIVLFVGFSLLVYSLRSVLTPFIYAAALVYLLQPGVDFLEKRGLSRLNGILVSYLILILIFSLVMVFVIPVVVDETTNLIRDLPRYVRLGQVTFSRYLKTFREFRIPSEAADVISQALNQLKRSLLSLLARVPRVTIGLFGAFFNLVLAPIIAFYALKDLELIKRGALRLIPLPYREEGRLILGKVDRALRGFVRGQLTDAIIIGILSSIGLAVLGIDFAVIIGMLAGFFNLIPYFGPIIGSIPAIIIALINYSAWRAFAVIVMFLIVQQLDSQVINPYLMRRYVGLHPLLVIFALLAGGLSLGLLGMLIAVPVTAVAMVLTGHLLEKREEALSEE